MKAVKKLGIPISKRVRLLFGTDEESGSNDIEHYYGIEKEAAMTFSPDEFAEIDALMLSAKIFAEAIVRLCK